MLGRSPRGARWMRKGAADKLLQAARGHCLGIRQPGRLERAQQLRCAGGKGPWVRVWRGEGLGGYFGEGASSRRSQKPRPAGSQSGSPPGASRSPKPPAAPSAVSASRKQGAGWGGGGSPQGVGERTGPGTRRLTEVPRDRGCRGQRDPGDAPFPAEPTVGGSPFAGGAPTHSDPHCRIQGPSLRRGSALRLPLPAHSPAIGFPGLRPPRIGPAPRGPAPSSAQRGGPPPPPGAQIQRNPGARVPWLRAPPGPRGAAESWSSQRGGCEPQRDGLRPGVPAGVSTPTPRPRGSMTLSELTPKSPLLHLTPPCL